MRVTSRFLMGWPIAALVAIELLGALAIPALAQSPPQSRYAQRLNSADPDAPLQSGANQRVSSNGNLLDVTEGPSVMPLPPGRPTTPYYEQVPARPAGPGSSPAVVNENGDVVESTPGNLAYQTGGMMGGDCCAPSCNSCFSCCCLPLPRLSWDKLSFFGGVQSFSGPPNNGSTGSFGVQEGVNFGDALPLTPCGEIGWQLGARFTQSNFSGADFTLNQRNQAFVTAGLFRRADWGLQGGVAFDYLHENWYYTADLGQIRGEISWVYPCKHEIGFWFATSAKTQTVTTTTRDAANNPVFGTANFAATDLYAFFYRRRFGEGSTSYVRAYGGCTGNSDGLLGADGTVAISDNWAFQTGFMYLIPSQAKGPASDLMAGAAQEGWNMSMAIVWYPGCMGAKSKSYNRPLFNVADNGSFIQERK